jgi:hypothetical protein
MANTMLPGGLNRGQLPLLQPVSQVGAINLERVANLAGANRSGIDPVDEGIAVDVDVLGSFSDADVTQVGSEVLPALACENLGRSWIGSEIS